MNTSFQFWDYAIFVGYACLILGVGLWVSRTKKGEEKNQDKFRVENNCEKHALMTIAQSP